jgi:solute carrier family 45 protein 1/2/4
MTGAGHLIGYLIGAFDVGAVVGRILGDVNNQQFKAMTVIASSALLITVGITSNAVTERILLPSDATSRKSKADSMFGVLRSLLRRNLQPPSTHTSHLLVPILVLDWLFPFLFYSSTWVDETYYRYERPASSATSSDPKDVSHNVLGNVGRLGSLALVIFSVIIYASSILLPYVIKSP